MFGLLHRHRLHFEGRRPVDGDVWSFAFRPESPVEALAGQHGILRLSGVAMKPFSLASAPEEASVLIGTSLASGSSFKTRLAALRTGDTVTLHGPIMNFTLDDDAGDVVFLAQGVGITPIRSMLGHIALAGLGTRTSLIHVAGKGHAYRADTERWATSAAYPQHSGQFWAAAAAAVEEHPGATFYIAGATAFVSATSDLLRVAGVPRGQIRKDSYFGYSQPQNQHGAGDELPPQLHDQFQHQPQDQSRDHVTVRAQR